MNKAKTRKKRIGFIARAVLTGGGSVAPELAFRLAKKTIAKNKKKLQKFVADKGGVIPSDNLEELAVQTAQVRNQEIQRIKDDPTIEADTIEEASDVFEQEQADQLETESYEGESDAFTEEAIGAVLGVAKGVFKKIKDKRLASGKKFLGKTKSQWDAKQGADVTTDGSGNIVVSGATNQASKDPLSLAVKDAQSGATETIIKKNLPYILIAVVVIAFFVMKKK